MLDVLREAPPDPGFRDDRKAWIAPDTTDGSWADPLNPVERGLADANLFIGRAAGRPVSETSVPEEIVTSVVTIAELQAGVLGAGDVETRATRLATLERLVDIEVLPVDLDAARSWALLRAHLAAIAVTHDLPVATQDDDFGPVDGVHGLRVIRV